MESSIKINSISIDLAAAADEIEKEKCQHFSIRRFVAEIGEKDHRKCWPFSADSVELRDHQSYSLSSLSGLKSRWWRCPSCIRDINGRDMNDSGKLKLDSDKKKDYQKVTLQKKVHRRAKEGSIAIPEHVSKRSKEKANISSWKGSLEVVNGVETMEAVRALGSPEIAGVVDDTVNKTIKKNNRITHVLVEQNECENVSSESRNHRRKTRKIRLLCELLSNTNKETLSKRGRKRKSSGDEDCRPPQKSNYASRVLSKASENASKSCDSEDKTGSGADLRPSVESQSTDSGFDKDVIKGKQRNKRFQVVESSFTDKELVPCTLQTQRTEKELGFAKKRKRKAIIDNKKSTMITFSNTIEDGNPRKPQSTQDLLNSKWLDRSFDRPLSLQEKMHSKDNDLAMVRTNQLRDFGSSFKPINADGCLRTGVNVDFRNTTKLSCLNDKLKHLSSTEPSSLQKDIYPVHAKGKEVVVQSKTTEQIDDIPMEIVELMAKNQYERCLPDKEEDKQSSKATTSLSKNALLIDLNETYDTTMENNTSKPGNDNAATKEGQFMTGKQNSLDYYLTSQFRQPYNVPSGYGVSPLTGPNPQTSHNCQWLGNLPTTMANHQSSSPSFRVLRACNTCQSAQPQQYREASHPIWPSSMPQKLMDNPNMQNSYSNESNIPAMHLLSLMDPRLRSNIPIDHSQNSKLVFSPVNQAKEFIGPGCNKTAFAAKQWPSDFTIIPSVGTSSLSFQSGQSSAQNSDFRFQASWNYHQEKQPTRKADNCTPNYNNSHHQKSIFTSSNSDPGKFRLLGASDSMALPLKFHMTDNAKKYKTKKAQTNNNGVSAWPPTSSSGTFVCNVNRNPADFTIPDAPGNIYMIKGEDLKLRKSFKKKPSLCKQDALKQNKKSIPPAAENA